MPLFVYKAADAAGKVTKGAIEAAGERDAVGRLQDMGLIPIRVRQAGGGSKRLGLGLSQAGRTLFQRVTGKDLVAFTQDLSALLEAGLPVDRALSILRQVAEKPRMKEIIGEVLKAVQGGSYLSDALAKYPRFFSSFYVNMVRAGEAGGVLEAVLSRLGEFLESTQDLKDYVKSALVYPVFLLLMGGVSIIILLTFVIPKFSVIFSDLGQAIPMPTQILLAVSSLIRDYWWALLGSCALAVFALHRYAATPAGRLNLDRRKLRAPVLGTLVRRIEVARFARTLGTMMESGVPILQALSLVKGIMTNRVIVESLDQVYDRVKDGERLSRPLEELGIFPSLAVQMVTVGEETGRLDSMLVKVAENYEKVVRNTIKRLISFLEPAMILLMGLVVGFIVVSMLLAIFSVNEMPF